MDAQSSNGDGKGASAILLHDPAKAAQLRAAYLDQCAAVDNIGDDRFARTLLAMAEATVRTNYFSTMPNPYITLKFASQLIPNLPDTAPLYEIHVNSPRMEGCHLRAGRIARGGIRYSDRPDDYRTEILDLMKTQTVKNAIIVPIRLEGRLHRQRPVGPRRRSRRCNPIAGRRGLHDADQCDARSHRQYR